MIFCILTNLITNTTTKVTKINFPMLKAILYFVIVFIFTQCTLKKNEEPKSKAEIFSDSLAKIYKIDPKKVNSLDTFITHLYQKGGINGNLLVAENGVIIYQKSLGLANKIGQIPLALNTKFQLASVSKQFTAIAILQLAERKKLDINSPVYTILPEFPFDSTITIRSLLCHSSGIPNYIYALDLYFDKQKPIDNQQVSFLMKTYKPGINYLPNTHFNYNNSNYMYLALIVEKISKMPFRDYAQKYLFEPAGMQNTFYYNAQTFSNQKNIATGYDERNQAVQPDYLDDVVGDKGIYSTVHDLYLWNMALINEKIVLKASLLNAFKPKMNYKYLTDNNYGYGWRLKLLPDSSWQVYHGGWWHGFKNYTTFWPQNNSMIIFLGNSAKTDLQFVQQINAFLKPEYTDFYLKDQKEETKE